MKNYNNFLRRPEHIEKLIVENMSSTRRLESFISNDEINRLLNIFKKAKKSNYKDSNKQMVDDLLNNDDIIASNHFETLPNLVINTTAALNWDNGTSEVLESKLRKEVSDFEVVGGKFYLNQGSFKLHTDSGSDENTPIYKIFTIPLRFDNSLDIFTPVFDQYWLGSCARFMRGSELLQNNTHLCIQDYENAPIFNLTNKDFDKNDYEYLSHIHYENLWGFSIESKNKWKKGDIFVIDRAKIHSSCDYGLRKTTSKIFMTIVTKLKQ